MKTTIIVAAGTAVVTGAFWIGVKIGAAGAKLTYEKNIDNVLERLKTDITPLELRMAMPALLKMDHILKNPTK